MPLKCKFKKKKLNIHWGICCKTLWFSLSFGTAPFFFNSSFLFYFFKNLFTTSFGIARALSLFLNGSLKWFFLFIYYFLAALGPCCWAQASSSCSKQGLLSSWGAWASHCGGFCRDAWALGHPGFRSCGPWAQLLRGMWSLPRPGIKTASPALAGRLLTTRPPGKSFVLFQIKVITENLMK